MNIQPRRRPSHGSWATSSRGDHINFQVNGKPIIENKPIVIRSMCSLRNHAGIKLIRKYKGKPEVNPVNTQISIRRLNISCQSELFFLEKVLVIKRDQINSRIHIGLTRS